MARIALIAQFYAPEPCAAANRMAAMVHAFVTAGHEVRVYTAMPSFPDFIMPPPYRGRRHVVEDDGGAAVERVATYVGLPGLPGNRVLNWLSVALGVTLRIVAHRERFDCIVVSSPPITLALPALAGAFAHRAALIVDVRDVWPDVAVKMGSWRAGGILDRLVGWIARLLYKHAALITCMTESARAEITARGAAPERIVGAPNGFDPVVPDPQVLNAAHTGVRDVVYVGNMGLATGLDVVVDAAALLISDPSIRILMIGGGADAERLRRRARDERLTNMVFTGTLPRARALRALIDAAVTVVPLVATIEDSIPTKLFDAMLVGTPIVVSAAGEARRLVERADAGLATTPGDAGALVAGVRAILDDPARAARYAANGPPFVRAHYDRAAIMRAFAERVRGTIVR